MLNANSVIANRSEKACPVDPHSSFQSIYAAVQRYARVKLRFLACADRKAELTAEAVGLAWLWHIRLCRQGRDSRRFPTTIAQFALRAALSGRRLVGQESSSDLLSTVAQRRHGIAVQSLSAFDNPTNELLADALRECPRCRVPDLAHFRVEFPRWLRRMSRRNRRFVARAAEGNSTSDLARMFQISKARISQMRRELARSWSAFCSS